MANEVQFRKANLAVIKKTEMAVKEHLTKEIKHWDHRAVVLMDQERAGKSNAKLNSGKVHKRAGNLEAGLKNDVKN